MTNTAGLLAAVQNNGLALEFATAIARSDKKIVLAAVQENGLALEFAYRDHIKSNKSIVLAAIKNDIGALEFASPRLSENKEFMLMAKQVAGDTRKAKSRSK